MRKIFCFAVAALSCFAIAQDAKVTYSTVAVSAKKAIAELAQKSGMNIQCSSSMEKEILILRLQDAPMSEVMKNIATVTSGAWKKEGEIYYLVADATARQVEENKLQQSLAAKIAANLKKQQDAMAKLAKGGNTDPPDVAMMAGFMGGNSSAMTKLAIAIGANQLATVPEGGRVVFSTNPNSMQRTLPASANAVIAEFVTEHNKAAALVKQDEPAKVDTNEDMAAFMELFGGQMKKPKAITGPPAKAIVVASRRGMFMGYTLELKLYDSAGKVLASSTSSLVTNLPFDPTELLNPKAPPAAEGPEIKLSPLAKELSMASGSFGIGRGAGTTKLSKELMDLLKDPADRDPLSFVHSEALIEIAKQKNEQLVANLPDGVMSFFGNLTPKSQLTATSFLAEIRGEDKAKIAETGGWLVVSPENPVQSRKQRTDRVALRDLIRLAQTQGTVGLDDLAHYATLNGSPMEDAPASMMYVMLFVPNALQQGMMGMVNWDMLRLYGLLDPSVRQSLRQGNRVTFANLLPGQQNQVRKMLFGAEQVLTVETPPRPNQKKQDPFTEMVMSQIQRFTGGNENDFRTEPTEIMPNGLPQDGFIVVNFSTEPVGQAQTMSTDFGRGASLGPLEFGMFKLFKDDPKLSQMSGQMPTLDDIKVGTRSIYNFSFYVAPSVSEKQTLNDDKIAKDAQVYKIGNLPSDFQKRIDEMAASLKNNPLWKMVGSMGGMNQRALPPQ